MMHSGEIARDPDSVERNVSDAEVQPLRAALRAVLPNLADAPVRERGVCLFTNTPDHDFIIDFHPLHSQVLISSPCSGHGFKFASAIGELQAELLTTGKSGFDLSPFRIKRWPPITHLLASAHFRSLSEFDSPASDGKSRNVDWLSERLRDHAVEG